MLLEMPTDQSEGFQRYLTILTVSMMYSWEEKISWHDVFIWVKSVRYVSYVTYELVLVMRSKTQTSYTYMLFEYVQFDNCLNKGVYDVNRQGCFISITHRILSSFYSSDFSSHFPITCKNMLSQETEEN